MFYSDFILFEDPTLDTEKKTHRKYRIPRRFMQLDKHTTRLPTKKEPHLSKYILKSHTKAILYLLDKQKRPYYHVIGNNSHRIVRGSSTQRNNYVNFSESTHYLSRPEEYNDRLSRNTTAITDRRRSQIILKNKSLALSTSRVYKNTRYSLLRIHGKYLYNKRRQMMDKDPHYLRLKDYFSGKYEKTKEMNEIRPW